MKRHLGMGRIVVALVAVTLVAAACRPHPPGHGYPPAPDRARYILPPGNYGGLPTTAQSLDQLPLYDALTPLRGHVTDADIEKYYLPENFKPIGTPHEEPTGRPGTTILYDEYGVPHVTGRTRADMAFGAGWVTARDRGLLLQLGRGPARVAVADVPGINAFGLVTSGQSFVPSAATEQLVTDQVQGIIDTYGDKGREMIADMQAEADGITAYYQAHDINQPPATVNDVIAVTAFIGSIFGAGGGAEASNAEFLSKLQAGLGPDTGRKAWEDAMLFDDPEAPTTIQQRFDYGPLTGGPVTGAAVIDAGSVRSLDPRVPASVSSAPGVASTASTPTLGASALMTAASTVSTAGDSPTYPAAGPVPEHQASNFLVVDPRRSATGNTLAVMGPQLGYYYPEIVQQIHLTGPGIDAQGIGVPAAMMYLLIGRTHDYAWSLTSANHDVRDVFAEQLCNPDGTVPSLVSDHYLFDGVCRPFDLFEAGTLNGTPIRYPVSVHGPIIGTATSNGNPVALARKRSTFGRDGLNLGALKDLTENKASTPEKFFQAREPVRVHLQLGLRLAHGDRLLLLRSAAPPGTRPRPPAADGRYRWVRMARLPQPGRAPARAGRARRPPAQLEQPVRARLHARRRRSVRLGAPRGAVRPVPEAGHARGRRQRDEPRRDRGRALPGVAGDQPGAARRTGPERPRGPDGRGPRRLGRPGRADARRGQQRAVRRRRSHDHERVVEPGRRRGHAPRIRGPHRRPRPDPWAGLALRRVVRRQGPAHPPARSREGRVPPALLRQRLPRCVPRLVVVGGRRGRGAARGRRRVRTLRSGAARPAGSGSPRV